MGEMIVGMASATVLAYFLVGFALQHVFYDREALREADRAAAEILRSLGLPEWRVQLALWQSDVAEAARWPADLNEWRKVQ